MNQPGEAPPTCRGCGATGPDDDAAACVAGWVADRDGRGRPSRLCPACARTHVRAIEARLDDEWW